MNNLRKLGVITTSLLTLALVTTSFALYANRDKDAEYRPMPEIQNEFALNGNLVPAMTVAIAEMRRYPPLTDVGRQIESYEIWVIHHASKGEASFTFVPRIDADKKSLKLKGAVESRIYVRMRDLKIVSKRLFN